MKANRILVCGVCCVDIVNYVDRFPEEDSDNSGVQQSITLGGNAANSGIVLSQLNKHTDVFVAAPADNTLFNRWEVSVHKKHSSLAIKCGLNLNRSVHRPTDDVPVSTVICNYEKGTRTILHYEGNLAEPTADEFIHQFPCFDEYGVVHFEGRNYDAVVQMMEHVDQHRQMTASHPKLSVELEVRVPDCWVREFVHFADIIFISKDFARWHGWGDMVEAVGRVESEYGAHDKYIICPWGEHGVCARDPDVVKLIKVDAVSPPHVLDTLGAGDTFIAACLHFLNEGLDLTTTLGKAVALAGRKVSHHSLLNLDLTGIS